MDDATVLKLRRSISLAASAVAAALILSALAPGAARAQGAVVDDEFGGSSLNTNVWTFVNPLGDASISVGGGRASISVPAGSTHDIWGTVNTGVGLRTSMPNRNFELEAKFDSTVSRGFQMQGIVVEQDSDDLLRAEVHYDGKATKLFVATMAAGVPKTRYSATVAGGAPAYVRVLRTGDQWQVKHSRDGSTWTVTPAFAFALNVVRAGPHVGNSGNPAPAWTAEVDRFREVAPDTVAPADLGRRRHRTHRRRDGDLDDERAGLLAGGVRPDVRLRERAERDRSDHEP